MTTSSTRYSIAQLSSLNYSLPPSAPLRNAVWRYSTTLSGVSEAGTSESPASTGCCYSSKRYGHIAAAPLMKRDELASPHGEAQNREWPQNAHLSKWLEAITGPGLNVITTERPMSALGLGRFKTFCR